MQHIEKALAAADRFGRLMPALAQAGLSDNPQVKAAFDKIMKAHAIESAALSMRREAFHSIAQEMVTNLESEFQALAFLNGARAEPQPPGVDEGPESERAARRIVDAVARGENKSTALADEMATTRLSSPAWVSVIRHVEELLDKPPHMREPERLTPPDGKAGHLRTHHTKYPSQ